MISTYISYLNSTKFYSFFFCGLEFISNCRVDVIVMKYHAIAFSSFILCCFYWYTSKLVRCSIIIIVRNVRLTNKCNTIKQIGPNSLPLGLSPFSLIIIYTHSHGRNSAIAYVVSNNQSIKPIKSYFINSNMCSQLPSQQNQPSIHIDWGNML